MKKPERSAYTPIDFIQWRDSGSLVISPKFQRRGVWSRAARSYLIDTLLLGLPVPPIYLRVTQDTGKTKVIREVVDGQQRVSAVLDFIDGQYSLAKNIESPCAGKKFSSLSQEFQDAISQYAFICEVFYGIEDEDILRIFSRLNTHSVPLNAQELRNGKYFGEFKKSAYGLALEHLEFWRLTRVFTERAIARMQEVELTSELLILQITGFQDKKKSIDSFYQKFDETFPDRKQQERRFRNVSDVVRELSDTVQETEFRRVPIFYSLHAAIFHRMYGIPSFAVKTPAKGRLTSSEVEGLKDGILELSDVVSQSKAGEETPKKYESFVSACLRQTDNIRPRRVRTDTIYKLAF